MTKIENNIYNCWLNYFNLHKKKICIESLMQQDYITIHYYTKNQNKINVNHYIINNIYKNIYTKVVKQINKINTTWTPFDFFKATRIITNFFEDKNTLWKNI